MIKLIMGNIRKLKMENPSLVTHILGQDVILIFIRILLCPFTMIKLITGNNRKLKMENLSQYILVSG